MAASQRFTDAFAQEYAQYTQYPTNLIFTTTYQRDLEEYRDALISNQNLCIADEDDLDVGFRDFYRQGTAGSNPAVASAVNAQDVPMFRKCLGDRSHIADSSGQRGPMISQADPVCRFIFLWSDHSLAPLSITKTLLQQILYYHQVMPSFLDFLSVFGSQDELRELRFSAFRESTFLMDFSKRSGNVHTPQTGSATAVQPGSAASQIEALGPSVPDLGRTGWGYQISYNLKSVVHKPQTPSPVLLKDEKWSIRQGAFHHQFDVIEGTTLWITTSSYTDIQDYIERFTGTHGRAEDKSFRTVEECFKSTLSIHLLLCHWGTKNWRKYLRWLEDRIKQETDEVVMGRLDREGHRIYDSDDLQDIQILADKANEAKMVMEANSQVMTSLRDYYKELAFSPDFTLKTACRGELTSFLTKLNHMIADCKMHISRAELMIRITDDRKDLLLQHMQSQATKKMECFATESQKEAIAMRIIAAVTVFYLPATFVSTFFSTDVVKYQNQNGGPPGNGIFSSTALKMWGEVTGVLTFLTLALALMWYYRANQTQMRQFIRRKKSAILPVHNALPPGKY